MIAQPRIVPIAGHTHPKARIDAIDKAGGFITFTRLDANDAPVDSGGSTVRFLPQQIAPINVGETPQYADPDDATVIAAIQAPPAAPAVLTVLTPLELRSRMTMAEKIALDTSTDPIVIVVRNDMIAAQEVRSDDPRVAISRDLLISKGIFSAERAAVVFA